MSAGRAQEADLWRRVQLRAMLLDDCWGGSAVAVLLDLLFRDGRLRQETGAHLVADAWDLTTWPMALLPADRWVALFRFAGYSHDGSPAERPAAGLRLFRGSDLAGERGMCWSSNVDVARWHAARFDEGWVWSAWVEPEQLLAFVAPVYEDQYVVDAEGLELEVVEGPDVVAGLDLEVLAERLAARMGTPHE